jgi:dTDP-glucose 4,6-dehydratase
MTMAYHRYHNMDVKIARIFNTFGPGMRRDDGRAIPNFITQALEGKPITVFGTGSQTRSFIYIDDMAEGIRKLLLSDHHGTINLGNPAEMTVLELAKRVIELTGSKSKIEYRELPEDDPRVRQPDIKLAKKLLNWEPKVDVRTGLSRTIAYFEQLKEKCSQ